MNLVLIYPKEPFPLPLAKGTCSSSLTYTWGSYKPFKFHTLKSYPLVSFSILNSSQLTGGDYPSYNLAILSVTMLSVLYSMLFSPLSQIALAMSSLLVMFILLLSAPDSSRCLWLFFLSYL